LGSFSLDIALISGGGVEVGDVDVEVSWLTDGVGVEWGDDSGVLRSSMKLGSSLQQPR
jgi:hypothetical protein